MMPERGDTERQACLRDGMVKKHDYSTDPYVERILSLVKSQARLLDIGCGTGHIIRELADRRDDIIAIGLDLSAAMIRKASRNLAHSSGVFFIEGDGRGLPFRDEAFDAVLARLAEYAPAEAYRVLVPGGHLLEYGLGPDADREVREFFHGRIEEDSFFLPENPEVWEEEVQDAIASYGYQKIELEVFEEDEHHATVEDLMNLIEMVPLVKDFDREDDKGVIESLAEKYGNSKGIRTTWHYYILHAIRP